MAQELGSELLLVDTDSGLVHALNPTAALLWACFDGQTTLSQIVADCAEAFGVPQEVIEADVLSMAREVGRAGLLEEVIPVDEGPQSDISDEENILVPGMPAGCLLVINWSAECAYCLGILAQLGAYQAGLKDAATTLLLVDPNTPEATRNLIYEHHLDAEVVSCRLRTTAGRDPFSGLGTPAAYWLGSDHRVVAPLAYGADPVVALARSAAVGDKKVPDVPSFLPVGAGACGPGAGSRPSRSFYPTAAYRVGHFRVGIRANAAWVADIVDEALAEYRAGESVAAPNNFSLILSDSRDSPRDLNILIAGTPVVARSRSPRRVMRALAGHLSGLLEPVPGLIRLDAQALMIGDTAVLLPKALFTWQLERVQAPLARLGVCVLDEPFAHVDLDARELVVPARSVRMRDEVLNRLEDSPPGLSEPAVLGEGRYPLGAWFLPSPRPKLSRSGAVAAAVGTLVADTSEIAPQIGAFTSLLDAIEVITVSPDDPRSVTESLAKWGASEPDK